MINFGAVPASSTLPVFFDSYAGATGASVTITGLAVTDIEIYKGTSMTQRSSDAGYTLLDTDGIDIDGVTGIHGFSIDLSDNTDAGFYAAGSFYAVVVSAITVDSQTVNFVAATFRIVAAESIAGTPKADVSAWLGTAAATPTVAGVPEVDLTHVAGATTDVSALATNVAAILVDTGTTLDGRIPAALVGGRMDANVGAISADATAADNAEAFFDGTGYAGTNNVIPLVTTATNLTNAPTAGDLTATMKTSVTTAATSATPTAAAITDVSNIVTGAITVSGGIASADIKKVNNVTVNGDGSGTPWGP